MGGEGFSSFFGGGGGRAVLLGNSQVDCLTAEGGPLVVEAFEVVAASFFALGIVGVGVVSGFLVVEGSGDGSGDLIELGGVSDEDEAIFGNGETFSKLRVRLFDYASQLGVIEGDGAGDLEDALHFGVGVVGVFLHDLLEGLFAGGFNFTFDSLEGLEGVGVAGNDGRVKSGF